MIRGLTIDALDILPKAFGSLVQVFPGILPANPPQKLRIGNNIITNIASINNSFLS